MRHNKYTDYTIGQRFGKLTLLKLDHFVKEGTKLLTYYWLCKCDCDGKEIWIRADRVESHLSCGCYRSRKPKPTERAMNSYFKAYKNNSIAKNLDFSLTIEQFEEITQGRCHYCGTEPHDIYYSNSKRDTYTHNGVDRINPSKGYSVDNCVPCCKICNYGKNNMSYVDFLSWIDRLIKFRTKND
jgi:hypothetical protein